MVTPYQRRRRRGELMTAIVVLAGGAFVGFVIALHFLK